MAQRSGSADDFPYDERLQTRNLRGLDRLRAIPDRKLAEYLYQLHAQAVRNEAGQRDKKLRSAPHRKDHHRVAARALAGDLGPEALELATYLLLDDSGRQRSDEASFGRFSRALQDLRRSQRS